MQPTPTRSPRLKPATLAPTSATLPTISCPGTHGNSVPAHSARTWCRSEWQTPQYAISIRTSSGPVGRRVIRIGSSGRSPAWAPHASTCILFSFECVSAAVTPGGAGLARGAELAVLVPRRPAVGVGHAADQVQHDFEVFGRP